MEATDIGQMTLFLRSILWDIVIPQCSALVIYEDNDAATAMANAQKPTPRTQYLDGECPVLAEWVECDLVSLDRVDITLNWEDHFTKQSGPRLFNCHADYILGHAPPSYSCRFKDVRFRRPTSDDRATSGIHRPIAIAAATARSMASWNSVTEYYHARL